MTYRTERIGYCLRVWCVHWLL